MEDPRNLWVIHGKRYDLRKGGFLDRHPGGNIALKLARGRDCTELFESYHALFDAPFKLLEKYEAEDQTDVPKPVFDWSKTPVYDSLKKQVREYFTEEGLRAGNHKCDTGAWLRYGLWSALTLYSVYNWLQGEWWSLIALPWFYWLGPSGLMHSGSHWALSKSEWVNMLGAYAGSFHISVLHWYHQHVIGHHSHTNMHEKDPDLCHFQHLDREGPGYRLHASQPWLEKYTSWRSAMPMQAWFTTLGPSLINQFMYIMDGTFMGVPVLNISNARMAMHILGRLCVLYAAMLHPFTLFPPWKAAIFGFLPLGFHGCIFYVFSQVSHANEASNNAKEVAGQEWAVHQIYSCVDYNTNSMLWRTLSIGLNAQAFHHLFPGIEPCHYGPLSEILARTCKQHGIRYTTEPSLLHAVKSHVGFVGSLNNRLTNGF